MSRWTLLLLWVSASLATSGCRHEIPATMPASVARFESGAVQIVSGTDTLVLRVEIAETPQQHRMGLRQRPQLPDSAGLIFLFQKTQPRGAAFWMYRTYVPLSIAFLDSERVIREIRDMEPCRSRFAILCPRYGAGVRFHAALEVNSGFFARHGITVGDRVVLVRSH